MIKSVTQVCEFAILKKILCSKLHWENCTFKTKMSLLFPLKVIVEHLYALLQKV